MPLNDAMTKSRVIGQVKDTSDNPIRVSHANPLQDTSVYAVQFSDGMVAKYGANLIAMAMFAQVDDEGSSYNIMDAIVDHHKLKEAIPEDKVFVTIQDKIHPVCTTKGWEMCVLWKNGDTSWEKLKNMKGANPIEAAEYAIAKGLGGEPAFNWWAMHTLKKCDSIISSNAYLTAPTMEKVWTVLGPEWDSDAGKKAIIVQALYGLKSSDTAYHNHFASYLQSLRFTSCLADPDVWLCKSTRPDGVL
jgi:hypothetical protein